MDYKTVTVRVGGEIHQVRMNRISDTECELMIRDQARILLYKPTKYFWRKKGKGAYVYADVINEVIKILEEEDDEKSRS
ncbi:hypothetical protein J6TS7_32490 [Paenibacillus dendritiformis]|uniref:hypothetical protein n=1 Tax=Paenibacillus TaxID=44249 RepID=UPI001B0FE8FB|nr:hypothetical protein [Paenibacillus dendritiformis]GIO79639.1 hypothetical protein J6TS7_32490 [Paenibacillus dendritiformis]